MSERYLLIMALIAHTVVFARCITIDNDDVKTLYSAQFAVLAILIILLFQTF